MQQGSLNRVLHPDNVLPAFREALAVHEAFRRLGFIPDQLFVTLDSESQLFVILKHRGQDFAVCCGELSLTEAEFHEQWPALITAVNAGYMTEADMTSIWTNSYVYQNKVRFILAIKAKGIAIPENLS
jgi:hypothetical protein